MKVLHVDPARTWRGGERQVFLLTRELTRRGHESIVAAAEASPLHRRTRASGLPTETLDVRGDLDPGAVLRLRAMLRRHRPDLLHLHTARAHGAGGLAARLARHRPVLVTRRLELPIRGPFSRWKYRWLGDHYLALTEAVVASLRAGGVSGDRITRVPSGVEMPPPPSGPPRPVRTIGTLAAFTPQKDPTTWLRTAIRVCRQDPDLRFVWAGEGELAEEVKVGVERAGLTDRIELPGFLEDPLPFWNRVNAFFLPSAFEAQGTVLLDALARGIPVVATRVGGIPEVVRPDREGLLAAPGDDAGLATALLRLRAEPDLAARLGGAGRARAEEYEIGSVVDRIVSVYERLLGPA